LTAIPFRYSRITHATKPMITAETAASLAAKSHEARRRNKLAKEQAVPAIVAPAIAAQVATDDYAEKTKIRVRIILDDTFKRFENEDDANKIDRLASALSKLAELDRQLSGRPLPGTLKPTSKPVKRMAQSFEPSPQFEPESIPSQPVENQNTPISGMPLGDGDGI